MKRTFYSFVLVLFIYSFYVFYQTDKRYPTTLQIQREDRSHEIELLKENIAFLTAQLKTLQQQSLESIYIKRPATSLNFELHIVTTTPNNPQQRHRTAIQTWKKLRPQPTIWIAMEERDNSTVLWEFVEEYQLHPLYLPKEDFSLPENGEKFPRLDKLLLALYKGIPVHPHSLMMLVNADIVLLQSLMQSIWTAHNFSNKFLLLSKRWAINCALSEKKNPDSIPCNLEIDSEGRWQQDIIKVLPYSAHQTAEAIDMFVFSPSVYFEKSGRNIIEKFYLGGAAFDNWMVATAVKRGADVINSLPPSVIHINHGVGWQDSHSRNISKLNSEIFQKAKLPVFGSIDDGKFQITNESCLCLQKQKRHL